jgi:hypothetical protein
VVAVVLFVFAEEGEEEEEEGRAKAAAAAATRDAPVTKTSPARTGFFFYTGRRARLLSVKRQPTAQTLASVCKKEER